MSNYSIEQLYDFIAPEYESLRNEPINYVEDEIISNMLSVLGGKKVLDVGCGTGNLITLGQYEPEQYLGIDISANMIKEAKRFYPNYNFKKHDAREKIKGKYDLIVSIFGQINYFGIDEWLNIIKRNLSKNGNFYSIMYSNTYKPNYVNGHAIQYSVDDIKGKLEHLGILHRIVGLSFSSDSGKTFRQELQFQQTIMELNQTIGCRYWVILGKNV
tara:strand:- start:2175 stop:2819 length:645 start_codon:yes stop_codon:yes gene_type:complete